MARDGGNLGIIQLSGKSEGEFTTDDELVLVQLSLFAASVIENLNLLDRSEEQRRPVEQALIDTRAAEERHRRLVGTAEEGIWLLDAEDRTTFVNRRMAAMLGFTEDEMAGRPLLDFVPEESTAEVQRGLEMHRLGVKQFLRKPVSPSDLVSAVRSIVGD